MATEDGVPTELLPQDQVDSIEFREGMLIVNFVPAEEVRNQVVQDHISRVIHLGRDEDVDGKAREVYDDVLELLDLAHVAKRNPPARRPM